MVSPVTITCMESVKPFTVFTVIVAVPTSIPYITPFDTNAILLSLDV